MPKITQIQQDLINVSWALNIFRLANSMIGVFIPLVILKTGGELWQIAVFYLAYAIIKLCTNYSAMRLILRKGAHLGLGIGFLAGTLHALLILLLTTSSSLLVLLFAAGCLALANAFIWNSQHLFISQVIDNGTRSSNIASIEIIGKVSEIVGPLIGGLIGSLLGAPLLVGISVVLAAMSIVPIIRMRSDLKVDNSQTEISYRLNGAPKRDLVANFCFNIETLIGTMFWPVYLAVVLNNYGSVGVVTSVAAVASVFVLWLAGRSGDRGKDRQVLMQGVSIASAINIVRIFSVSIIAVGAVSVIYKSALAYFQNAWTSTYYYHAKNKGSQYIISMEIACDLAYVAVWGLLLIVLLISADVGLFFTIGFVIAAVAAWGCLLITSIDQKSSKYVH